MLLPRTCPLCHRPGPAPCDECASTLERAPNLPAPARCGRVPCRCSRTKATAASWWRGSSTATRARRCDGWWRRWRCSSTGTPSMSSRGCRRRPRAVASAASIRRNCWRREWRDDCADHVVRCSYVRTVRRRPDARAPSASSVPRCRSAPTSVSRAPRQRLARRRCRHDGLDDHGRGTNTQSGRCRSNRRRRRGTNTAQAGAHESRHQRR